MDLDRARRVYLVLIDQAKFININRDFRVINFAHGADHGSFGGDGDAIGQHLAGAGLAVLVQLRAIEMAKEVVSPIEIHIRHYISPT